MSNTQIKSINRLDFAKPQNITQGFNNKKTCPKMEQV